jgi:hypothetical protein
MKVARAAIAAITRGMTVSTCILEGKAIVIGPASLKVTGPLLASVERGF